jgi:hypothetical protein
MERNDMATTASLESEQNTSSRWLKAAQLGWLVFFILALLILLASVLVIILVYIEPDLVDSSTLYNSSGVEFLVSGIILVVTTVIAFGLAVLLYWRKRDDWMALFLAYFFILYGVVTPGPFEAITLLFQAGHIGLAAQTLNVAPVMMLLYIFPTGTFVPRWSRWLVVAAVIITLPMAMTEADLVGNTNNEVVSFLLGVAPVFMLLVGFYGQFNRYRHIASARERLQVKWVVYGFVLWMLINAISVLPYNYVLSLPPGEPVPIWIQPFLYLYSIGLMVVPISFTVAVLRYRLWDIDFIIRRTLIYGILTGLLVGTYFGSVILIQTLFTAISGQQSPVAIVISTLIIAALFQPLRRRIQSWIDRRFFRAKYNAANTLASFATTARDEVDLEKLSLSLMQAVNETMQPEQAWLWLKSYERLADDR